MADPVPNPNHAVAVRLLGGDENLKLLWADEVHAYRQSTADERRDARRRASNDAAFDHLVDMMAATAGFGGLLAASQEGEGEAETAGGTEEEAEAGTAIGGQDIADALGQLAQALVPIVTAASGAGTTITFQSLSTVMAAVIAAAGKAAKEAAS